MSELFKESRNTAGPRKKISDMVSPGADSLLEHTFNEGKKRLLGADETR